MRILSSRPLASATLAAMVDQVTDVDMSADALPEIGIATDLLEMQSKIKTLRRKIKALKKELLKAVADDNLAEELPALIISGYKAANDDRLNYARACALYTEQQLENEYDEKVGVAIARALAEYFRPSYKTYHWEAFVNRHSISSA